MNTQDTVTQNPIFPKVIATMREGNVTIVLGRKHFIKTGDDAAEFYYAAMNYSSHGDITSLDTLENMLYPHKKYLITGEITEGNHGEIYFKDTPIPIPASLSDQLFDYLDNGWPIEALRKFWYRAMLNTSDHARDGFFTFCKKYGVTITDNGYALLYKAVTTKIVIPRELDLASLVGERYLSLIRQGEDPSQFIVTECERDSDQDASSIYYDIIAAGEKIIGTPLGTLADLFHEIPILAQNKPTTTYTDKHTKTMDIRLGVPCVKTRSECDPDISVSCSYGLHVGSFNYVSRFASYNDTVLACLVDPANVVALPESDDSKIRVCDYLPYAIMNRDVDGAWEELESSYFESDYEVHDAVTLNARFMELAESLGTDLNDFDRLQVTNVMSVVESRLKTLSHVDLITAEDVTQAPSDLTEFDQNDPDCPENTFKDPDKDMPIDVKVEIANFQNWLEDRQNGTTSLSYEDWKNDDDDF